MQFSHTVCDLLTKNRIPTLDAGEMADFTRYLFTASNKKERIQVAEAVYRHDHDHSNALDIFLACLLPLAEKSAHRRAYKVFNRPSDWQLELMCDGAVGAVIAMFQSNLPVTTESDAFRRYVSKVLVRGALRTYFRREENHSICTVDDPTKISTRTGPICNEAEAHIITRDLLNRVTGFSKLRPHVCATLECIQALGPDEALKEHGSTKSGDPDKWKRNRDRRPILDPNAIAQAMGTDRRVVHINLREARIALRKAFNADGKLFLSH